MLYLWDSRSQHAVMKRSQHIYHVHLQCSSAHSLQLPILSAPSRRPRLQAIVQRTDTNLLTSLQTGKWIVNMAAGMRKTGNYTEKGAAPKTYERERDATRTCSSVGQIAQLPCLPASSGCHCSELSVPCATDVATSAAAQPSPADAFAISVCAALYLPLACRRAASARART